MTPEGKVKAQVKKMLDAEGVYYFLPVSNGMGRHGIPDIIGCVNGRFLAIECKAANGKTTALQDREIERIASAGGTAVVCTGSVVSMLGLQMTIELLKDATC